MLSPALDAHGANWLGAMSRAATLHSDVVAANSDLEEWEAGRSLTLLLDIHVGLWSQ